MKNTNITPSSLLPDHIAEYMAGNSKRSNFVDLFEAEFDNVDLRTDLSIQEIILVNKIKSNNTFLANCGLIDTYDDFLNNYQRLKVSLDRKSRGEFVSINRRDNFDDNLQKLSNFKTITDVKK